MLVTVLGAVGVLPGGRAPPPRRRPHHGTTPPACGGSSRATGYPTFLIGLAVSIGVRTPVLALRLGGRHQPPWRVAMKVYLVALPPVPLASQFNCSAHAALYSRLFGAAVGIALIVCVRALLAVPHGPARYGCGVH